jgi:diaminopropionate ammonia-lyase
MAFLINPDLDRARPYGAAERAILSVEAARTAHAAIGRWPGYTPTPVHDLPSLAAEAGVGAVWLKDEGRRFSLKSFKALGGAYAVERLAAARGSDGLVVTCATDGNHGRSVAWGARRAGAKAVIYVHQGVSQGRADAISAFGADVVRAGATYDESVHLSAEAAAAHDWTIVSDTSWPGYEDIPKDVMQGYAVMALELAAQNVAPTHVFVQGGVGGLAAGVLSYGWETLGAERPVMTVVEPETAACLFLSAKAGKPVTFPGDLETVMAGLSCGEPSILAWAILGPGADAFMTIADVAAETMMCDLARLGRVVGESGVAGLAGFRRAAADPAARAALGLGPESRVLCYATEGATDPLVYARIVGKRPEEVG